MSQAPRARSLQRALLVVLAVTCAALAPAGARAGAPRASGPREYGCPILPRTDPLNQEVAHAPVSPESAAYVASIGLSAHLHPDFGTEPSYGIPYAVAAPRAAAGAGQVHRIRVGIKPRAVSDSRGRTDRGWPGAEGDRHVLVIQEGSCMLYELYGAARSGSGLDGCLRRGLQPAQQRAAPGRMDLGRRRGPADLPAARALPGGRLGADRPRAAGDGAARRSAATSTPPPTTRPGALTRTCRRWACGCGCGPATASRASRESR